MGRLRKFMPITAATFIVGWLAIAGVPPFAGFWSKDEILLFALAKSPALYVARSRHRAAHRVLHDPPGDHGLLRRGPLGGPRRRARRPRRLQAARVPVDHADRRSSCSPAVDRRRAHPAADVRGSPTSIAHQLEHWLEPVVEFGEADIVGTWAVRQQDDPDADRHRRGRRRHRRRLARLRAAARSRPSSRRSSPTAGTTTGRSPSSWAAPARDAFEGAAWFDANVVDGAVNGAGAGRARRRPASCARARPATCAATPGSSASASCCCSAGSWSSGGSSDVGTSHARVPDPHRARSLVPVVGALARRARPASAGPSCVKLVGAARRRSPRPR